MPFNVLQNDVLGRDWCTISKCLLSPAEEVIYFRDGPTLHSYPLVKAGSFEDPPHSHTSEFFSTPKYSLASESPQSTKNVFSSHSIQFGSLPSVELQPVPPHQPKPKTPSKETPKPKPLRKQHNTSGHFPLALLSFFFIPLTIVLFVTSTCPLLCG